MSGNVLIVIILVLVIILALIWRGSTGLNAGLFSVTTPVGMVTGGAPKKITSSSDIVKDIIKQPRSKSEAAVISYLKSLTGKEFPTVLPSWLIWKGNRLELDGYNRELMIAVEFSGPQHTKWNSSSESYTKYFDRIVRDVVKVRTCRKHKIKLMVIDASLPSRHWRTYVWSRLYDYGRATKPVDYLLEQHVKPFRNKQLEKELGLTGEWQAAKKI